MCKLHTPHKSAITGGSDKLLRRQEGEDLGAEGDESAFVHCIGFALRHLDAVIRDLREGEPYCVCRACRGIGSGKSCGTCGDTGFITRRQYDMLPPEFKAEKA